MEPGEVPKVVKVIAKVIKVPIDNAEILKVLTIER